MKSYLKISIFCINPLSPEKFPKNSILPALKPFQKNGFDRERLLETVENSWDVREYRLPFVDQFKLTNSWRITYIRQGLVQECMSDIACFELFNKSHNGILTF